MRPSSEERQALAVWKCRSATDCLPYLYPCSCTLGKTYKRHEVSPIPPGTDSDTLWDSSQHACTAIAAPLT